MLKHDTDSISSCFRHIFLALHIPLPLENIHRHRRPGAKFLDYWVWVALLMIFLDFLDSFYSNVILMGQHFKNMPIKNKNNKKYANALFLEVIKWYRSRNESPPQRWQYIDVCCKDVLSIFFGVTRLSYSFVPINISCCHTWLSRYYWPFLYQSLPWSMSHWIPTAV